MTYFEQLNLIALYNKNSKIKTFYSHPEETLIFLEIAKNKKSIVISGQIGLFDIFMVMN